MIGELSPARRCVYAGLAIGASLAFLTTSPITALASPAGGAALDALGTVSATDSGQPDSTDETDIGNDSAALGESGDLNGGGEAGAIEGVACDDALLNSDDVVKPSDSSEAVVEDEQPSSDVMADGGNAGLNTSVDDATAVVRGQATSCTAAEPAVSPVNDAEYGLTQSSAHAKGWDGDNYYDGSDEVYTGWVVDNHEGNLERYWVESGKLWRDGLKRASFGYWFYSLSSGRVLRGSFTDGELVYLADNDGRLAGGENGGWVVSRDYGQGLQRYYIDADAHAAVIGYSSEGYAHYTTSNGYTLRGVQKSDGIVYAADNDGKLGGGRSGWVVSSDFGQGLQRYWFEEDGTLKVGYSSDGYAHYTTSNGYVLRGVQKSGDVVYAADNDGRLGGGRSGWAVSSDFGQGLQRYWFESDGTLRVGYSEDGWAHYTTSEGYVLRGALKATDGGMYYADNDGKLKNSGWLVTSDFGQGLQRYWFVDNKVASEGLYQIGSSSWTYATSNGYVLRGALAKGALVYLADNDGLVAGGAKGGWVVSSAYGQGLQRYWIEVDEHAAKVGYSTSGWAHYTTSGGYVLRGVYKDGDVVYAADNDGRLGGGRSGWVVSSDFGQGLQRYWFDADGTLRVGYSSGGWDHYTTSEGYVARGKHQASDGSFYLANNDGKLEKPGWVITSAYDGSIQRYYIDSATHAAKTGLFQVSGDWYFGLCDTGYELRGSEWLDGAYYYGDNDGKLVPALSASVASENGSAAVSTAKFINGEAWLFLPANAHFSSLSLSAQKFGDVSEAQVSLDGGKTWVDPSAGPLNLSTLVESSGVRIILVRASSRAASHKVNIMQSSSVASLFISSDDVVNKGRHYIESDPDHKLFATGALLMVEADGAVVYDGKLSQIKGHGNSTWSCSKKSYQIKLDKKCDLTESGNKENKAKTWTLITDRFDRSSSRDVIAYHLAQQFGVASAVDYRFVNLYYDGEYRGTYLVCEKVQINSGRVDITDLEEQSEKLNGDLSSKSLALGNNSYGYELKYAQGVTDSSDISGGYLFEHEYAYERYSGESAYFSVEVSGDGEIQHFVCKAPEVWSYAQANYLSCLVQDLFDAARNGGVVPNWRGSSRAGMHTDQILDVDSLANVYWVNEIMKNRDGYVYSSGYLYKDSDSSGDGKLTFGPAWDFDLSSGNTVGDVWDSSLLDAEGWWTRESGLACDLMNDPYVYAAVQRAKSRVIAAARNYLNGGGLATDMGNAEGAIAMNLKAWPGLYETNETWTDVRNWLNQRLDWIERN